MHLITPTRRSGAPLWFGTSLLIVLMLLLAACGGDTGGTSSTTAAATDTPAPAATATTAVTPVATDAVKVVNFAFNPKAITVKVGTTVTWTNTSITAHTVTSDTTGGFDKPVDAGAKTTVTFSTAGTFTYHCAIHPNMTGTVVVTP